VSGKMVGGEEMLIEEEEENEGSDDEGDLFALSYRRESSGKGQ
jgi:hypothetical protein